MNIRILNKELADISKGDAKLFEILKNNSSSIDIDLVGRGWIRKVMGIKAYIPPIKIELETYLLDKIAELITHKKV
jgi:hypothetical protein